MNDVEPKKQRFTQAFWSDAKKLGSPAPSAEQIQQMLEGDTGMVTPYTRSEVVARLTHYFTGLTTTIENENGESVRIWRDHPTKSGLARCLDMDVRTLLNTYRGNHDGVPYRSKNTRIAEEDRDLIRKAVDYITEYYESRLADNRNPAGLIFWLTNARNDHWINGQNVSITAEQKHEEMPIISTEELASKYSNASLMPPPGEEGLR